MATAFYPQFDLIRIDASGVRVPLPSETIDVYNVTGATSLGTLVSDANGIIVEGSFSGVSIGDVVEFSHATYPEVARCTLQGTQEDAYYAIENDLSCFVVENLFTSATAVRSVDLYVQDLDNLSAPIFRLGGGKSGTTVELPYVSGVAKNLRIFPISLDEKLNPAQFNFDTTTNYQDLSVPAGGGITVGNAVAGGGANRVLFEDASQNLAADADFLFDGSNLILGNAGKRFEIGVDASYNAVFGHAYSAGDNILQYQFKYYSAGGYGARGVKLVDTGNGYETVLSQTASGSLYITDGAGTSGALNLGTRVNPGDASTFTASSGLWAISAGLFQTTNTTEQMRVRYDSSNYVSMTVSSAGVVTFDAVGSGAKVVFSDKVEFSDDVTFADAKNIAVGTTTGTKIGTSSSQKIGFYGATPVTQRANIGALTDTTGGSSGSNIDTILGGSDTIDAAVCEDNFRRLLDRINTIEQVFQDLGLTA